MIKGAPEEAAETLPSSRTRIVVAFGAGGVAILVSWQGLGVPAGVVTAVAVAALVLFMPRALVLDEHGFRLLSLCPRRKVLWRGVDGFSVSYAPAPISFVHYAKAGRKARWWYPAGWPAQGGIPASFAVAQGGRALSASELAGLLNERLDQAVQRSGEVPCAARADRRWQ